jgi:hypothetical protein
MMKMMGFREFFNSFFLTVYNSLKQFIIFLNLFSFTHMVIIFNSQIMTLIRTLSICALNNSKLNIVYMLNWTTFTPVWSIKIIYMIHNYVLYRIHVTEMSGRNRSWSRGQVLHRSQSLRNLMPGEDGEPDTRLQFPQATSRSHATIRTSSEEEGLELLGSATDVAISSFEEVDTSLLDYDSDTPELSTMQAQPPAAMDTDSVGQRQESSEMDATYFQCRAARQSSHKDLLISVSRDDSFGRNVTVPSAAIGSFESHGNISSTFHGSRVMRGNLTVNESLTLSLTALGPISPISFKCHMLKKCLSGMKAILHVFLF